MNGEGIQAAGSKCAPEKIGRGTQNRAARKGRPAAGTRTVGEEAPAQPASQPPSTLMVSPVT